ncbi:NfeD family protein [Chloroflexota bacterium]
MSGRLILAVMSTILEEVALAVIVVIGLPKLNINLPVFALVIMMLFWAVIAVTIYRAGSRVLKTTPMTGLETMVGSCGRVVKTLHPEGLVKIRGELWQAKMDGGNVATGGEVVVIAQKGNRLTVRLVE